MHDYVARRGDYLDAERFAAIAVGPKSLSAYFKGTGRRRSCRRGYGKIDGRMLQHNGGIGSCMWRVTCLTRDAVPTEFGVLTVSVRGDMGPI